VKIHHVIGNTPLIDVSELINKEGIQLFAKLEGQNPGGSVKDRAAYSMIKNAFDRGDINKDSHLVEATSGNTGIALAMIAQSYGIKISLIMPDGATPERVKTMKAYGAEVILTPAERTIEYSRELAEEMVDSGNYFMLNQFANSDNKLAHYKTTGPEIWRDTDGSITHFVAAMGTTGTIMGVSRYLKEQNPAITIVGTQPTEGSKIPGIRRWSQEFLPKIFEPSRVDKIIDVSQDDAIAMSRKLANTCGILAGMSSGGALAAALEIAKTINKGVIVFIVCDRGDRYLSSALFE
jgi:cysteine synthase B